MTEESLEIGLVLGITIPIISCIIPIQAAIGKNLRESLDLSSKPSTEEINIRILSE